MCPISDRALQGYQQSPALPWLSSQHKLPHSLRRAFLAARPQPLGPRTSGPEIFSFLLLFFSSSSSTAGERVVCLSSTTTTTTTTTITTIHRWDSYSLEHLSFRSTALTVRPPPFGHRDVAARQAGNQGQNYDGRLPPGGVENLSPPKKTSEDGRQTRARTTMAACAPRRKEDLR
ncbi:hypothetical protein MAPG_03512 [Magnaporthiopsis poae ATCC 64411]|uniref:Uncharacterized protein n=1 Tax=Magnaporthiopsis poae (strain ATCC 64411 / 73-15) TaxID=644358 RepID=A0A0C4DU74_MAGP6|nr:hypothetical protein MAPG_03512 [Magnaporthiopsis poae ATCC 64411]